MGLFKSIGKLAKKAVGGLVKVGATATGLAGTLTGVGAIGAGALGAIGGLVKKNPTGGGSMAEAKKPTLLGGAITLPPELRGPFAQTVTPAPIARPLPVPATSPSPFPAPGQNKPWQPDLPTIVRNTPVVGPITDILTNLPGIGGLLRPFTQPTTPAVPTAGGRMAYCGSNKNALMTAAVLSGQIPMIAAPVQATTWRAPCGYVLIRGPNNATVAILKEVAYALGLRRRRTSGGGISGRDLRAAERVQRFIGAHTVGRAIKGPKVRSRRKRR